MLLVQGLQRPCMPGWYHCVMPHSISKFASFLVGGDETALAHLEESEIIAGAASFTERLQIGRTGQHPVSPSIP